MKTQIFGLTLAMMLYIMPAWAQHGHAGGMGAGAGSSMGAGPGNSMGHGSMEHGSNMGNNASASHGQTMNEILTRNAHLADKIQSLTGISAQQACSGFKNLGQCVAAAHVSKNLNLPFACLQADMTGSAPASGASCPAGTGTKSMSLGKAIQTLSPNADSKSETKKANQQADDDLRESNS